MAQLRFYFHQEATLQGASSAPAGCHSLSLVATDQVDNTAGGGHTSGAATGAFLVAPGATSTVTAATPPTAVPVPAAQQLAWFSDSPLRGQLASGGWLFNWREHDAGGPTGGPKINLFASGSRAWGGERFLATIDYSATNWWTGAAVGAPAVNSITSATVAALTLNNEYLIVQLWCQESAVSNTATHVIHTEFSGGNDTALNASQRSSLLTPNFATYQSRNHQMTLLGVGM